MVLHARPKNATTLEESPADDSRSRLVLSADTLFYNNGIPGTRLRDVLSAAKVSRREFRKHFSGKDDLIAAYIANRHSHDVEMYAAITEVGMSSHEALELVLSEISTDLHTPGFRGCAFINAAAECNGDAAVLRAVQLHREWYVGVVTDLLRSSGHLSPADAADDLVLARDGAMSGWYNGDTTSTGTALGRVVDRVLTDISSLTPESRVG